ncbi:hypothetical protein STENM223S_05597 [Streptomyces tendae]
MDGSDGCRSTADGGLQRRLVRPGQGRGTRQRRGPFVGGAAGVPKALASQTLDWTRCEGTDEAPAPDGDWSCATLKAPLDWSQPGGETIGLALIRSRATGDDPIGSLLFNFGGPGASGVSMMPSYADTSSSLHERYDLVSWDPRGVAASEGVRCRSDESIDAAESVDSAASTTRRPPAPARPGRCCRPAGAGAPGAAEVEQQGAEIGWSPVALDRISARPIVSPPGCDQSSGALSMSASQSGPCRAPGVGSSQQGPVQRLGRQCLRHARRRHHRRSRPIPVLVGRAAAAARRRRCCRPRDPSHLARRALPLASRSAPCRRDGVPAMVGGVGYAHRSLWITF